MQQPLPGRRGVSSRPARAPVRLQVEPLESRDLLSAAAAPGSSFLGPADPPDTLDHAAVLGDLSGVGSVRANAAIGDSAAGAADVDWYAFRLDRPAAVTLAAFGTSGALPPVLSLYVRDPFDPGDPATFLGVRRLAQVEGTDPAGGTQLARALAAGTYYLAASGAGNELFNPFVPGSGYDGQTGNYRLQLAAADLGLGPADGPAVLASDPAAGSTLDRSPFALRLDLSAPIDPTTVLPGDDVRLTRNAAGTFGDAGDQDVPLDTFHFSAATNELQLTPAAPLAPGYYRLRLAGDSGANFNVLTGADGTPLGTDALHPAGQDFALTFHVAGVEGNTAAGAGADDTPAGAHDLGDVSDGRLVQAAGAIGDDPTDPVPFDRSGVDLYHFRVSGPGRYALAAEVFAERIDSPLNAAASLFVLDPTTGHLRLLTGNDDTQDPVRASDQKSLPLFTDPALFAGITAGDYYLAVSSHGNVPDPNRGLSPGADGIFDPEVSHSGSAGRSRGDYVLNLRVGLDDVPPHVLAVAPAPGSSLAAPPKSLTVTFDKAVNLQQLAFAAYQRTRQGSLASVYVRGADGVLYYPRLQSFDPATGQATFLMLDRLPPGDCELHLSGPRGLGDFAGNPLAGNDPGGDCVTHFTVRDPGVLPSPEQAGNDDPTRPQDVGVLFPHELEAPGVTISRDTAGAAASGSAAYQLEVLQAQNYFFLMDGSGRPAGVRLTLTDVSGAKVDTWTQADGVSLEAFLTPGTYVVRVSDSASAGATRLARALRVVLGGSPENPQPLTLGPAPVLCLRLAPAPLEGPEGPAGPTAAPGAGAPTGGVPPAKAPALAAGGVVPAGTTTGPAARIEAPSGLLAALGAGPVGGVGAGTVGGRVATPLLSLGGGDGVTQPGPARLAFEIAGRLAGVQEAVAGAQDTAATPAGERSLVRAAAFVRAIDYRRWWGTLFEGAAQPSDAAEDALWTPAEVGPPNQEDERAAVPKTVPGAEAVQDVTAPAVACLAAAAGAVLRVTRRRRDRTRMFSGRPRGGA